MAPLLMIQLKSHRAWSHPRGAEAGERFVAQKIHPLDRRRGDAACDRRISRVWPASSGRHAQKRAADLGRQSRRGLYLRRMVKLCGPDIHGGRSQPRWTSRPLRIPGDPEGRRRIGGCGLRLFRREPGWQDHAQGVRRQAERVHPAVRQERRLPGYGGRNQGGSDSEGARRAA